MLNFIHFGFESMGFCWFCASSCYTLKQYELYLYIYIYIGGVVTFVSPILLVGHCFLQKKEHGP